MIKIGVTGQNGFIGTHLCNSIRLLNDQFALVHFERDFFRNEDLLDEFVCQCDVIVHLAGLNRHKDSSLVYDTNIQLVKVLVSSLERVESKAHIIFSSSSQEANDSPYGKSKKDGRAILTNWALLFGSSITGLVIPNVYGPFGTPYHNSVIATFSYQVMNNIETKIDVDSELKLLYIDQLVSLIMLKAQERINEPIYNVDHTSKARVSELLELIIKFKKVYHDNGDIPSFSSDFELNLFNTFRSYIDIKTYFPVTLNSHVDSRGSFTEIIKLGIGGQVSFSTTLTGITRGNHFHTRKIERFAVIKGEALIQLRRIGSNAIHEFHLSGETPAYVDMPIWYTHNITNIGESTLLTVFWINEPFDPTNTDTYFVEV